MILVGGGDADPNIGWLKRRLAGRRRAFVAVSSDSGDALVWDLDRDRLLLNGRPIRPAALFLRLDVFRYLSDRQPESQRRAARWHRTLLGWALAHEAVTFPNRAYGAGRTNKLHVLVLASRAGLAIPETIAATDPGLLGAIDPADWIVKPVDGGSETRVLADPEAAPETAGEPAIYQRRLVGPDLRIYRVRERWFAFALDADGIDYRVAPEVDIRPVPAPPELTAGLARVMDALGLDWGAADFKRCPRTGRDLFLEVNSQPMFVAFDRVAGGAITDALIDWLAGDADAAAPVAALEETPAAPAPA